jgi:GAF domain-containing protein
MSEETPSGGFRRMPETVERLLFTVRKALDMDVAFVSEFAEDQLLFRALEGDAKSFGWREGEGFPLDNSYCKRVLDGRIPSVVPDAKSEGSTKDLWVTSEADIGSYVAVPVVRPDGRLYGTLCCASHKPNPRLRERDLESMQGVARELSRQLKREALR